MISGLDHWADYPGFAVWLDGWQLYSVDAAILPLRLDAQSYATDRNFGWDLTLTSSKTPVRQGRNGYSAKGPGQASYYYSYTRLLAQGIFFAMVIGLAPATLPRILPTLEKSLRYTERNNSALSTGIFLGSPVPIK